MKKVALINDLSGFGKCSLSAAMPIISVMGAEVHPLPTAVLSNQTAYDSYKCLSLTDYVIPFAEEWKKLNRHIDVILTGFMTDEAQIDAVIKAVDMISNNDTLLVVDPIMADNGSLYDFYNQEMCERIIKLCYKADIITPNISELFIIAGLPYSEKLEDIRRCADYLISKGMKCIVVTGYKYDNEISNIIFTENEECICTAELVGGYYSGTGDILSSIVAGGIAQGIDIRDAVNIATKFISLCVKNTEAVDCNDGVDFEKYLYLLGYDNIKGGKLII